MEQKKSLNYYLSAARWWVQMNKLKLSLDGKHHKFESLICCKSLHEWHSNKHLTLNLMWSSRKWAIKEKNSPRKLLLWKLSVILIKRDWICIRNGQAKEVKYDDELYQLEIVDAHFVVNISGYCWQSRIDLNFFQCQVKRRTKILVSGLHSVLFN